VVTSSPPFPGILFHRTEGSVVLQSEEPAFFADLHLDQILAAMAQGREQYHVEPFFYTPVRDADAVRYRHEVLRDLEEPPVFELVEAFSRDMRAMRVYLARADKLRYRYQKERWFLDAVGVYCDAVASFAESLARLAVASRGLRGLRDYVASYSHSDAFASLAAETRRVQDDLADVAYSVHIKGNRVRVSTYQGEADYSAEVVETFAKFKQGAVKDYRVDFPALLEMNHVEAQVLDLVARLFPEVFRALDEFCARHQQYLDDTIRSFDREVQFYVAYLELIKPLQAAGLSFSYPHVSARSKDEEAAEAFDLSLAKKLAPARGAVVCNDFFLKGPERVLVVTGPNQGGKTTFARMFGQLHYLVSLGLPVPAAEARLFLPDRVFAHFEREEDIRTQRGKLEDELTRVRGILEGATGDSVVIMNESLASTTLNDALYLGGEVLKRILERDLLCVYVTFVDELASLSGATVSMVGTVSPDDPAVRTYKIVRKPADGLAYAAAIAGKHGLTYASVKRRIAS